MGEKRRALVDRLVTLLSILDDAKLQADELLEQAKRGTSKQRIKEMRVRR